jgi:hypoxanthine phosphoribosyltransferase
LDYKAQVSEGSSLKEYCTWQEVEVLVEKLAHTIQRSGKKYDVILAIANGGIIPARLIARELDVNHIQFIPIRNKKLHLEEMLPLLKGRKYLIVDEIYDTGDTFSKVFDVVNRFDCDFAFLMTRYKDSNAKLVAKILDHDKWVVFPWERKLTNHTI